MISEISQKERWSNFYLTQLQSLLDKQASISSGVFQCFKEPEIDGAWWMHTDPDLLVDAGFKLAPTLSFLSWFAWLADKGKARLQGAKSTPYSFLFRIGPTPNQFEDLVVVEPEWLTTARGKLDQLIELIAKSKQEKPEVRQHKASIIKVFDHVAGWHQSQPVDRLTEDRINIMTLTVDRMLEFAQNDVKIIMRRFQSELEDTNRDLENGYSPDQRSLSNYPDWQRAKERLSAWMEIKGIINDALSR